MLSSGEPADRITLKVDENNISEFTRYVANVLPGVLNELTISGLSFSSRTRTSNHLQKAGTLGSPASISVLIDEQGLIREQSGMLSFTDKKSGNANIIEWTHRIDDVNQTPKFTQETPRRVKNLQDLLRHLLPAAAS